MQIRIGFFGQVSSYSLMALRQLLAARSLSLQPLSWKLVLVVESWNSAQELLQPFRWFEHPEQVPEQDRAAVYGLVFPAVKAGIKALQARNVNAPAIVAQIAALELDWLVCVGFDRLFRPPLLAAFRQGGINAHPTALPQLRGPSPIFWLLRRGERAAAVTLHRIDHQADHGPIYQQMPYTWPLYSNADQIYQIAGTLAGQMLLTLFDQIAQGLLLERPQNHQLATRAPYPSLEDAYVEPRDWNCEALVGFVCGAIGFHTAWTSLPEGRFWMQRGVEARPGSQINTAYIRDGRVLILQCRDGVAIVIGDLTH